jgi:hypothetical protein
MYRMRGSFLVQLAILLGVIGGVFGGINAIVTQRVEIWNIFPGSCNAGIGGDNHVHGMLAVILGVGWIFAAIAGISGAIVPKRMRETPAGYMITGIAIAIFLACFLSVVVVSLVQTCLLS